MFLIDVVNKYLDAIYVTPGVNNNVSTLNNILLQAFNAYVPTLNPKFQKKDLHC